MSEQYLSLCKHYDTQNINMMNIEMISKKTQQKTEETNKKQKRWGKKFEDKRNWKEYNEGLVRRGELYLSLDFLESWDNELDKMNKGKKGAPFAYPEPFVNYMGFIYSIFHIPYRQMEGYLRKLSGLVSRDISADYTTLFKRIAKMNLTLPETLSEKEEDVVHDFRTISVFSIF